MTTVWCSSGAFQSLVCI